MALSARAHYACIALLELAVNYVQGRSQPVAVHEIARRHGLSHPFLRQILNRLRVANLVVGARGSGGGYMLLIPPDQLNLRQVLDAVGESWQLRLEDTVDVASPAHTVLCEAWEEANRALRERLEALTFDELATRYQTLLAQSAETPDWVI